jgi:hypothetical protein
VNTLNKSTTRLFFKEEAGYAAVIARWSGLVNDVQARERLTASDHLLYLVLRGKDWRRGFQPVTNANRVANGHAAGDGQGFVRAVKGARFAAAGGPLSDLLTAEAPSLIAALLPIFPYCERIEIPDRAYRGEAVATALGASLDTDAHMP